MLKGWRERSWHSNRKGSLVSLRMVSSRREDQHRGNKMQVTPEFGVPLDHLKTQTMGSQAMGEVAGVQLLKCEIQLCLILH